ncbi:MAG: GlsB/YeaQ/YmgE family stress response membrane protein [Candidatus Nanopelagicales bacterium]|nr:GlsB/YeaQ/YmgE family stress response membrane protein [Candidatus Nanopelagicales bacterium]
MEIDSILSGLGAGIVIGLIARIIVPSMQPIGCLMSILIGVVGGAAGGLIGSAADWGFWLTFATQIVIAAILVAIVAALFRKGDSTP